MKKQGDIFLFAAIVFSLVIFISTITKAGDTITVRVDEALTRLNDGGLQLSANSDYTIHLSETTNVEDWMLK